MQLSTLLLCRDLINKVTLNVGADDFPEVAPLVLAAKADLDEAIKHATTDQWPGTVTPLMPSPAITEATEG
jgi:hypothetical protein